MILVSPSMFRDSCEVTGKRYFKISIFPCVWIFLRCLHEEETESSSCWNYKEWAELQDSTAVTGSLPYGFITLLLRGLQPKIWLRTYKSKLVFKLSFFYIFNSESFPIFLSKLQLCNVSKWLKSLWIVQSERRPELGFNSPHHYLG